MDTLIVMGALLFVVAFGVYAFILSENLGEKKFVDTSDLNISKVVGELETCGERTFCGPGLICFSKGLEADSLCHKGCKTNNDCTEPAPKCAERDLVLYKEETIKVKICVK